MNLWSKIELHKIAEADDLHISPLREDGKTYGTSTWIWSVAVGDRPLRAPLQRKGLSMVSAALREKAGRITAVGMTKEVAFEPADGARNELVDDAYRSKYGGSPYLKPMISARTRAATVKVIPKETRS